jgi:hypothetical protein
VFVYGGEMSPLGGIISCRSFACLFWGVFSLGGIPHLVGVFHRFDGRSFFLGGRTMRPTHNVSSNYDARTKGPTHIDIAAILTWIQNPEP